MSGVEEAAPSGRGITDPPPLSCPICGSTLTHVTLTARDRLVTGEGPFEILECRHCCLGITRPQLTDDELSHYYPRSTTRTIASGPAGGRDPCCARPGIGGGGGWLQDDMSVRRSTR